MHEPIRDLTSAGLAADRSLMAAVLALNNAHAADLSLLSDRSLADLIGMAWRGGHGASAVPMPS
ncbi:hypothetical protein ACQR16_10935 [Bradyrhizobium oligotrophicum]|uniref:hypothetical protein n=1 Tax=Bradyrhizobium oligotrophicum TaxID=44255 RepID=UPI003EBF8410